MSVDAVLDCELFDVVFCLLDTSAFIEGSQGKRKLTGEPHGQENEEDAGGDIIKSKLKGFVV